MCAVTKAFKTHYGNRGEGDCQGSARASLSWVLKDEQAFLG
jgi:hypothetical protein